MKIKKTINFKMLREKGPKAVEIKGDEVVQLVSQGTEIKYILTQEHYLKLETAYNALLISSGLKKEKIVSSKEIKNSSKNIKSRINKISKLAKADEDL